MTFIPFEDPNDILGNLLSESEFAPGLDGSHIPVWYAAIGGKGEPGKQVVGTPVPGKETITDKNSQMLSAYRRELLQANLTSEDYEGREPGDDGRTVVEDLHEATVYSSALIDKDGERTGFHTIAIDIDHPVRLRETDTPGHYHLLVDVPMPWESYKQLLVELTEAGVIETGYYEASVEREGTHLRLPWVHKTPKPEKVDIDGFDTILDEVAPYVQASLDQHTLAAGLDAPPLAVAATDDYEIQFVDGQQVLRKRKS